MFSKQSLVVIRTLLPPGEGGLFPGIMESGFEDFYREHFSKTTPFPMRFVFRLALFFGGWISPFLIGKLSPLSRLSLDDQEKALWAMGASRFYVVRQLLVLLKTTLCLGYGGTEVVRRAIGYPLQFDGGKGAASLTNGEVSDAL